FVIHVSWLMDTLRAVLDLDFGCKAFMFKSFLTGLLFAASIPNANAALVGDCFQEDDIKLSISACTTLIEREPAKAALYLSRGDAYRAAGDLDKSIEDYSKAIELTPGDAELYCRRGTAYQKRGDLDRALKDGTKAIEIDPKSF